MSILPDMWQQLRPVGLKQVSWLQSLESGFANLGLHVVNVQLHEYKCIR